LVLVALLAQMVLTLFCLRHLLVQPQETLLLQVAVLVAKKILLHLIAVALVVVEAVTTHLLVHLEFLVKVMLVVMAAVLLLAPVLAVVVQEQSV
jgi:hypothetical protein